MLAVQAPASAQPEEMQPSIAQLEEMQPFSVNRSTSNVRCYGCHGEKGFGVPLAEGVRSAKRLLYVDREKLQNSVHGQRLCVDCHRGITVIPHSKNDRPEVDCITCHSNLHNQEWRSQEWRSHQSHAGTILDKVVQNIAFYMESVHGKTRKDGSGRSNAGCSDCHQGHTIAHKNTPEREAFRLATPEICGRCHPAQLRLYEDSEHGSLVLRYNNTKAAVCADCHTAHKISSPHADPAKLVITKSCGNCHQDSYKTYTSTYHGQVNVLGYAHTAKCFDCHTAHANRRVDHPDSSVFGRNREKTCQKCHEKVSPGFLKFLPHGNAHDIKRYPELWWASKLMIGLVVGVFLFFWSHSALWFYREFRERRSRREVVPAETCARERVPHIQRFPFLWRLAHLSFALSIMTLAFTGMTVLYSDAFWAPTVARFLGGAAMMALVHRVAAVVFTVVFFAHLGAVLYRIFWRNRKTFRWFGPTSLLPHWGDLKDFIAMMRWFFGKGPRPVFDHWTYWEKFDYWAPFWGMFIIGSSGLILWFPKIAGEYFPGWIFNVATIIHGEEAFLAVVFIFSVHFFNCHFRPSKFPLDIMMFVGRMPLEEFKHERQVEYARLKESGQLVNILAEPPSSRLTFWSRILGFTLIAIGLTLLLITLSGFGLHAWEGKL
ncbi:MAG: cytochrome b/b6 domain-containing protein [Magnetococcales bacterium]|nr:cytochrome b/b6 domain-containing protein [Magnetococcales bacterium]MBF0322464.1 cytochrome b/b6 domain-containing protein [Magnetococcales bacterium]